MHALPRGRGRPADDTAFTRSALVDPENRLVEIARELRSAFERLPPREQADTLARVQLILAETDQRRLRPSPLARMAEYVYGLVLDWVPPDYRIWPGPLPVSEQD